MTLTEIRNVLADCAFPNFGFDVREDGRGAIYLQGVYHEADVDTGEVERQFTRRWLLSPVMTVSEIAQTAFLCVLTSAEHRTREHFRYRGRAVFGPHYDVERLWEICDGTHVARRKAPP